MNSQKLKLGDKILTAEDLSVALGISVPQAKRLLREDKVKGFKMGKFWRTTQSAVDEYIVGCIEAGNGRSQISGEAMAKIKFHAGLKSKKSGPDIVEKMEQKIQEIIQTLPTEDTYSKFPSIAKLKASIEASTEKQKQLNSIPDYLESLADEAYPGIRALINEAPEALVAMFKAGEEPEAAKPEVAAPAEEGQSKETPTMKGYAKDQTKNPDEEPWITMNPDDAS